MQTKTLTRLVFLITLTLIIQTLGLPQPITGPLINMMLFITTLILGVGEAMLLGLLTPLVAVFRGQLPPFLLPMVPFIIVSNFFLVIVFQLLRKHFSHLHRKNPLFSLPDWIGLIAAAVAKFAWLYVSARVLLPVLFGRELSGKLLAAMSLPQLVTAISGGVFAFIIYNLLSSRIHIHSDSDKK